MGGMPGLIKDIAPPSARSRTDQMMEYRTLVETCRKRRLDSKISNSSPIHAGILIENLLQAALDIPDEEAQFVRLRSRTVDADFYSPHQLAILQVMDRGVKVRVLLEDAHALETANGFLRTVVEHEHGDARVVRPGSETLLRFIVVGSSAYRVETNSDTFEAIGNFNDQVLGCYLTQRFDTKWALADNLPIPAQ